MSGKTRMNLERDQQKWEPVLHPIALQNIIIAHDLIAKPLTLWRIMRPRLYNRDASARHPDARCRRAVLQARRLPYRSGAAGGACRDHPRPLRPRPPRPWRGAGDPGNARPDAAAL